MRTDQEDYTNVRINTRPKDDHSTTSQAKKIIFQVFIKHIFLCFLSAKFPFFNTHVKKSLSDVV